MKDKIELYQPCNGTEMDWFHNKFCANCSKMPVSSDAKNQCKIFGRVMNYDIEEKGYPNQWRVVEGSPLCTAFISREQANAKRRSQPRKQQNRDTETLELF